MVVCWKSFVGFLPLLNWFQSEELKERLRKLQELQERKEYEELVKGIAPRKDQVESFSSYKDQLGFGEDSSIFISLPSEY